MQENNLIKTFFDLVKIDSPSGFEDKIIEEVFKIFTNFKLKTIKDSYGNLIVKVPGEGLSLLFSAHVDTVEPGRGVIPYLKKGIIRSKGKTILGADNKVAIAAIIELIKFLVEKKCSHRSLELVFTKSEEAGNFGAINLDYNKILAKEGYVFDSANPVGTIVLSSPFYNRINIEIIGKAAHASTPEKAINAINIFNKAMKRIRLGKINAKTIVNIGILNSGTARNTIPGGMNLEAEVRSYLESDVEKFSNLLIKKFEEAALIFGAEIKSSKIRENQGYIYKRSDKFVIKTKKILKKNNINCFLDNVWGCSDANIFNQKGIKVLNLGDGIENPHTFDELVRIKEFLKLKDLLLYLATN